jgi:hypothetical protein
MKMKTFLSKMYIIGFMVLTVFFMFIIWKVTFGHIFEEYEARKTVVEIKKDKERKESSEEEMSFKNTILEGEERVSHYLGYRVLEQMKIEGHFHHIDHEFGADNRSYCIACHGDIPHDKVKEIRAFGNMHSSFIACETCHIRLEQADKTGIFKWYDRTTGEIVPSPIKEGVSSGAYGSKIIPFERVDGLLRRFDTQSRIDFSMQYREAEKTLSDLQKSKAKKIIHKIVNKKPYVCEDCHQKEDPLLPFEALGYPKKRIDSLQSTEVVGMIKDYTKFFIPRMLQPGFGTEAQTKGTEEINKQMDSVLP